MGTKFDIDNLDLAQFFFLVNRNVAMAHHNNKFATKQLIFEKIIYELRCECFLQDQDLRLIHRLYTRLKEKYFQKNDCLKDL